MPYHPRDRINVCLDEDSRQELRQLASIASCSEGELIRRAVTYMLLHPADFIPPVIWMRRAG
jgi:hypothetical protein